MRLVYLIGDIGPGGAERQLLLLADGMADRGHEVHVLAYASRGAPATEVRASGARIHRLPQDRKLAKARSVRRWLRGHSPDLVHASMKRASSLAVLTRGRSRHWPIVATDMSTATYAPLRPSLWPSLALFARAQAVVTQTQLNADSLARLAPWLRGRISVIRNGVDTSAFTPIEREQSRPTRALVVGTVHRIKNPMAMVEAAALLADRGWDRESLEIRWVGRLGLGSAPSEACLEAVGRAAELGLDNLAFVGPSSNMPSEYGRADYLVHVAVQEGFPNVVVEALASGRPVIVGRVSDLPTVVERFGCGLICDQTSAASIADAMELMMDATERHKMGVAGRRCADDLFSLDRFVGDFEALYCRLLDR